jgi:hypothetical protein
MTYCTCLLFRLDKLPDFVYSLCSVYLTATKRVRAVSIEFPSRRIFSGRRTTKPAARAADPEPHRSAFFRGWLRNPDPYESQK